MNVARNFYYGILEFILVTCIESKKFLQFTVIFKTECRLS